MSSVRFTFRSWVFFLKRGSQITLLPGSNFERRRKLRIRLNFTPAEEFPQIQILDPLYALDWMVHGPLVQPGHLFELVCVSSELDELRRSNGMYACVAKGLPGREETM